MAPSATRFTELKLREDRRKWTVQAFGTTFIGSGKDRTARVTADKLMYASIKDPLYGAGWGPSSGTGVLTVTDKAINTRAVATATINAGAVTGFTILIKGFGYGSPPAVTITGGGGTGATGTAVLTSGRVTSITVGAGGSGYTTEPTVSIATPNGEPDGDIVSVTAYGTDFYMVTPAAGSMTGNIKGCECFFRDFSDSEYSLAGEETEEIDLGTTGTSINVASNAVAASTELYITHREIHINYVDVLGSYWAAVLIPYTGTGVDSAVVDVSSTTITNNRPLEDQRQTGLFPAVRTAEFYEGRIWGAVLEARLFEDGTTIEFVEGSDVVTIAGDTFIEADVLKGIVDTETNIILATIDRVITSTTARIRLPNNTELSNEWREPNYTLTTPALAGDEAMIIGSPIYQGNPGGGIKYGMLTFNALDAIRDANFYSTGARVCALKRCGDKLAVIYDRGIGFFKGEARVESPPTLVSYIAAEGVGGFNPDAVWVHPDGTLWFQGNGRIWVTDGGNVTDATALFGCGALWRTKTAANMHAQNLFQVSYNPETDEAVFVNIPKKGEAATALGTYALLLNHGTRSVHGLRWPTAIQTNHRMLHDNGVWQMYGAGGTTIYKLLTDASYVDSYYDDEEVLQENVPITMDGTTGTMWVDGTVQLKALRLVLESLATSGLAFTVYVDYKKENVIPGTFTADIPALTITHKELKRIESIPLHKDEGFGVQIRITGQTTEDLTLIKMALYGEQQGPRGFGDAG